MLASSLFCVISPTEIYQAQEHIYIENRSFSSSRVFSGDGLFPGCPVTLRRVPAKPQVAACPQGLSPPRAAADEGPALRVSPGRPRGCVLCQRPARSIHVQKSLICRQSSCAVVGERFRLDGRGQKTVRKGSECGSVCRTDCPQSPGAARLRDGKRSLLPAFLEPLDSEPQISLQSCGRWRNAQAAGEKELRFETIRRLFFKSVNLLLSSQMRSTPSFVWKT